MKCTLLFSALAVVTLSPGCTAQCGSPSALSGVNYQVFAMPQNVSSDNPAFSDAPDFWSYGSPANGASRWSIKWGPSEVGAVEVLIDGQSFAGGGVWDNIECGHILITDLNGVYTDESGGSTHNFNANIGLTLYGTEFGGEMFWAEAWQSPDGESGLFKGSVQLMGSRIGG